MYLLNKILYWLLYQGVHDGLTETQIQDVKFINGEAITVFLISLPSVPICYFFFPDTSYYLILLCFFCSFFFVNIFNRFRLYEFAKSSLLIVAEISIFWAACTFGKESNLHYVFIVVAFASVITFQSNDKKYLAAMLITSVLLLLILYITDFSLFATIELSSSQIKGMEYTSFSLCFIGSIVIAFFYINKFSYQRQQINDYNIELEKNVDELRKLNTELDRFVYSVSHDLRAPIASVLGLIYLSRMSSSFEEVKLYADLQEKSLKKLESFIADILDYSKNNRMDLNVQEVDFQQEFEDILELQTQYIPNQKIETQISIQQPNLFFTDKQRLNILLNNLVSNAFRYYNPDQKQSFIHLSAEVFPEKAIIKIMDNGIGIGREHIEKIFGMFYRATSTVTGSGLGLYITKEVVEKLKGKISVSSELGKGTDFIIEIPNLREERSS